MRSLAEHYLAAEALLDIGNDNALPRALVHAVLASSGTAVELAARREEYRRRDEALRRERDE